MRTVSLVERIEFEYKGNLFSKAVALGDVDNDQGNELVLGNVHGELCIYKGKTAAPWRKCTDLGMITCVEVGNILNDGKNYVVTLCVEGWCHIIRVNSGLPADSTNDQEENPLEGICRIIKPFHQQQLAANSKVLLVADINGDGHNELVIGYSDRRVRAYRWVEESEAEASSDVCCGKFVLMETWQLAGQIGSMTIHKKQDGVTDLMVSQPGGTFVTLYCSTEEPVSGPAQAEPVAMLEIPRMDTEKPDIVREEDAESCEKSERIEGPYLIYHPLGSSRARNPSVTTEVVGNISRQKKEADSTESNYAAVCLLDGTITLVDDDDKILWSLYVNQQLFTLAKLDVTGDGIEEVIACSWDGQTYIVDLSKEVVRFHLGENVAAFCAGYYAVDGRENVPCFIYATFNDTVVAFYNIKMSHIGTPNLIQVMSEKPQTRNLLENLDLDASNTTELRELYQWCLYGMPQMGT